MNRIASFALMLVALPALAGADDSHAAQITRYKVVEVTGEKGDQMAQRYSRVSTPEPGGAHFDRAIVLYAQGPDAADEIIAEADLEIAQFPGSVSARLLKAKVLKGTNHCKEALAVLDDAERILEANQEIAGSVKYLRAECLYHTRPIRGIDATADGIRRIHEDAGWQARALRRTAGKGREGHGRGIG